MSDTKLRKAIETVLRSADGMTIESEGNVYIRSLEGENYVAGIEYYGQQDDEEIEYGSDITSAINYFFAKRNEENHG
jgi:hypothetical protein